jgi:predicted N-acetyltransferase YhbS
MKMVTIRQERPVDEGAREALLDRAYGNERHGKPSAKLRNGRLPAEGLALVAVERGRVLGTVRLWHVQAGGRHALLLGPLAVEPDEQCRGIGGALMQRAIDVARAHGHGAVLLVGDAAYYGRFGFSAEKTGALSLSRRVDPARLLALELKPDAMAGASGRITATGQRAAVALPSFRRRPRLVPRAA